MSHWRGTSHRVVWSGSLPWPIWPNGVASNSQTEPPRIVFPSRQSLRKPLLVRFQLGNLLGMLGLQLGEFGGRAANRFQPASLRLSVGELRHKNDRKISSTSLLSSFSARTLKLLGTRLAGSLIASASSGPLTRSEHRPEHHAARAARTCTLPCARRPAKDVEEIARHLNLRIELLNRSLSDQVRPQASVCFLSGPVDGVEEPPRPESRRASACE